MARFCSLYSGSGGNCIAVGSGGKYILIDAGRSAKKIRERLSEESIDPQDIAGIFITHEHIDHIAGVRVLASSLKVPVYATEGTAEFLQDNGHAKNVDLRLMPDGELDMGSMGVSCFATSHDAAESCGFRIRCGDGRRISLATDTGVITDGIRSAIEGSDLVYLESNHDLSMLYAGGYPYPLKKRIASDKGHLSNEACSAELPALARAGTTRFVLGHLSAGNNIPVLARQTALQELSRFGMREGTDFLIAVAGINGLRSMVL